MKLISATCLGSRPAWAGVHRGVVLGSVLGALAVVLLAANAAGATTVQVDVGVGGSVSFSPQNVTIAEGDSILWKWVSGTHTTTSDTSLWNVPITSTNQTYLRMFNTAGTYPYHCTPHWSMGMTGTITVTASDTTPPTVISTYPADGASGVPLILTIQVTFSEPMAATTSIPFPIGGGVSATESVSGDTLTITFSGPLLELTTYGFSINTVFTDLAGNALASPYFFAFTTGDFTPPTVTSTAPANAATGVPIGTTITVTFSEPMDQTSTKGAFSISPIVTGNASLASIAVLTFTPATTLASGTMYTVTIGTGATDSNGVALAAPFSFSFTTAGMPPVTGVTATATSDTEITLTWTNPTAATFADVLIVRQEAVAPTFAPINGQLYVVGTPTLDGSVIVFIATGTTFSDTSLTAGVMYYYVLFARDTSLEYSTGVPVNVVENPDEDDISCGCLPADVLAAHGPWTWAGNIVPYFLLVLFLVVVPRVSGPRRFAA